jgi:hypothetical protein
MGREIATIKYAIGSVFGNTFNTYLFGSGILTFLRFGFGLIQEQTIEGAARVALNYYISKLTPFPLNEFLTASGFEAVLLNIGAALAIGAVESARRYRKQRY